MSRAVEVVHLSKSFRQELVLRDITISFEAGKTYGIIGRNGSGKTVLMKCIVGFMRPTEGHISVWGKRIGKDCDFAPDTGMIIETPGFIENESGSNNLKWLRNGRSAKAISIPDVLTLVGLDPKSRKPVGKYSLGMRQRLGIAQAIMEKPKLLILDEPMNGLDNRGVEDMRKLFRLLKDTGTTIILSSHNPLDISELCDVTYEMDGGKIKS